ncbi:hypothetical protein [Caldiplasma sukawensis]
MKSESLVKRKRNRRSKRDPYRDMIRELMERHNLSTVRMLEDIRKRGYDGGYRILKYYCHELRKNRGIQEI